MSNLCRVTGESIQFLYNIHERKVGKGGSESLRELTAGTEKAIAGMFDKTKVIQCAS